MTAAQISSPLTTAIVGAGMAGLACANALAERGATVSVFDKGRGPGGRMSTKRLDQGHLDLGAQAFTARDPAFQEALARWISAGLAARWPTISYQASPNGWQLQHDPHARFTGVPRMSAITRHLADTFQTHERSTLKLATRIEALKRLSDGWQLIDTDGNTFGPYQQVVFTTPPPQTLPLVADWDSTLAEACRQRLQRGCWAAWAILERPLPVPPGARQDWHMARADHPALRLVSRNHTKPGREHQPESLSLMAQLDWSDRYLEHDPQTIADDLWAAFQSLYPPGTPLPARIASGAHRWRYAQPAEADDRRYLYSDSGLAMCGDSFTASRVESAWCSGTLLAHALVDRSV